MNRNIFFQRTLIFILLIGFLIITFISTILITKNFVENDKSTIALKRSCQIIKNLLKKELLKPPVRFSSFFNGNNSIFETAKEYQVAYDTFSAEQDTFFQNIYENINYIELNLRNRNYLPVFFDNSSQYLFYPLNNIKAARQEDLAVNFKKAFLKKDYHENRGQSLTHIHKLLNYLYIELNPDKKILVLISPPRDPDPLYPNNKRELIIFCLQKKEGDIKAYSSYIEKVKLSNEE